MIGLTPKQMMILGVVLLLIGVVLPFMMVLNIIVSNLFINFFSYAASISGLVLGIIGTMMLSISRRKRE